MRLAIVLLCALLMIAAAPPPGTIQVTHVIWKDAPPALPKGSKVAVLEGDPKAAGIFTMRLQIPAGSRVDPHTHPRAERVTVISGEVQVGFGDAFVRKGMTAFHAGDFYVNPPDSHHFVYFPRTSVLQITGEGPWELHPLK
jgi:quercetin dioxygenase-like cupin family protein